MDSFVFVQIASLCLSDQKDVSLCPNIPYHYTGMGWGPAGRGAGRRAPGGLSSRVPSTAKPEDLTHTQCEAKTKMAPVPPFHRCPSHMVSCILPHTPAWAFSRMCPEPVLNGYLSPDSPTQGVCLGGKSRGVARTWSPERAATLTSSNLQPLGPNPPGCSAGQSAGGEQLLRRALALTCPQGARSEHFSTQAQGPQTPARKGLFLQGGPPAVMQPPNRKSSCKLLVGLQLLSSAPRAGVKGTSIEVEKPLGFSEDLPFCRGQSWKKPTIPGV